MNVWFDVKYAWRLLVKSWGHSLMCASVVALSVGLAVWTYALAYSQLFEPLGFPGSDRWYSIQIAADASARPRASVDAYTYQELLKQNRTADHLGAFSDRTVVLSEGRSTTSLRAAAITPRLLAGMGVAPILGRTFQARDADPDAAPVAILSFAAWQHYFAGDAAIVGRTARIGAAPVQIVGVMPRGLLAFDDYELWMPLQMPRLSRPQESTMTLFPLIAVQDGQSVEALMHEIGTIVTRVNADHPQLFNARRHVALIPAAKMFTHSATPIIVMMSCMAAAVMLLGCVNISMVFLARLLERSRELALRTALGASRARMLRQCLLETALIVTLGLAAGYALAAGGIQWTQGISGFGSRILATGRSTNLPTLRPIDFIAALVAAAAIWLLSTLIPARRIARQDAAEVLAGSGKGATLRGSNRSVALLVGIQVVISCLVLVVCANVVLAITSEVNKHNGLDTNGVVMSTYPTVFDDRFAAPEQRLRYWDDLKAAVQRGVPGADVAITTAAPTRPLRVAASIESRQGSDGSGTLMLPVTTVSDNYFELMGIRLRSGRLFDATDNRSSLDVAIVDEKMAARYWPDEDVLGKRVQLNGSSDSSWLTIVGVVSGVRGAPYRTDADLGTLYQPLRQMAPPAFQVLVKTPASAGDSRVALRAAAFAVDRDLPLHNLQTLDDYLAAVNLSYPAMVRVFIVIGLVTALLAASGLFGLISRSVAQRTQEVGIRRALGATPWRATSMFQRQIALYLVVAVFGLALGVMVTPMLGRVFTNILDDVIPATLAVVVLIAAVIVTASYLPTRRALALEPGDALRYE